MPPGKGTAEGKGKHSSDLNNYQSFHLWTAYYAPRGLHAFSLVHRVDIGKPTWLSISILIYKDENTHSEKVSRKLANITHFQGQDSNRGSSDTRDHAFPVDPSATNSGDSLYKSFYTFSFYLSTYIFPYDMVQVSLMLGKIVA